MAASTYKRRLFAGSKNTTLTEDAHHISAAMFRRRWSSLPCDPAFPSDLKQLGYFVNEIDEIRSIENRNSYFRFFITKNERWNDRQRFAMNGSSLSSLPKITLSPNIQQRQ